MDDPSPALRELIDRSGRSVSQVAVNAGVHDRALRRWYYQHTRKLCFISAAKVYYHLTGKSAFPAGQPVRRKGRKAA